MKSFIHFLLDLILFAIVNSWLIDSDKQMIEMTGKKPKNMVLESSVKCLRSDKERFKSLYWWSLKIN